MSDVMQAEAEAAVELARPDPATLLIRFRGDWTVRNHLPERDAALQAIRESPPSSRIAFDTSGIARWDSGLLAYLQGIRKAGEAKQMSFDAGGLPDGVRRLLSLAAAVPERGARGKAKPLRFLERLGTGWLAVSTATGVALAFVGETVLSLLRLFSGRAQLYGADLLLLIQQTGAQALPIVALISVLVGLILAFVGAVQLKIFGAQIYVANLVAVGMTREMGAMMAAIIMAGRTGAAFAAQLGTMQVNEEIDALKTLGVNPSDFLVLPRILSLILMMPLLCIYAIVLGILGGAVVGVGILELPAQQYWNQTVAWLRINDVLIGVSKSVIFGVIIGLSGCLRGMRCGRSAAAVGEAATSAVVTAIVWIVVADGLTAVITSILGI